MSQREMIGRGELTYKDGSRYVGDLVNRRRNGNGTLTWPNGERYEGGYVDEKRQGRGTYTWAGGHKFTVRIDLHTPLERLSLERNSLCLCAAMRSDSSFAIQSRAPCIPFHVNRCYRCTLI